MKKTDVKAVKVGKEKRRGSRAFSCTFLHTWDRLSDISLNKMPLHYNRIYVYLEFLSCCNGLKLISSLATNMEGKTFFQSKMSYLSNRQSYHSKGKTDPCMKKSTELQVTWSSCLEKNSFGDYVLFGQMCLQRMNYKEEYCQGYLKSLRDCCDMWGEESYKVRNEEIISYIEMLMDFNR